MIQDHIHQLTLRNNQKICQWFRSRSLEVPYPIYSSYDIRDSGYKVTNVDANIFPAGFNNICPTDKESAAPLFKKYLVAHYEKPIQKILLITEEHTNNSFYWENVFNIQSLLEASGCRVKLGFPRRLESDLELSSASGQKLVVHSAGDGDPLWREFQPDLVISNNDFSDAHPDWHPGAEIPINPPREMGWYQRKKSRYFFHYNNLVNDFSEVAGIDPFLMRVETEEYENFDLSDDQSRRELANRVDAFIDRLRTAYSQKKVDQEPFVFVKNNSGTYGLAVIKVTSGKDVLEWSYKSRKKMKASKGGRDVEEVIIQEGIPSRVRAEGSSAEPVIYMIGCELAGGFLRTHSEKSSTESLNSPGAVYKKMCVSDLAVNPEGCPNENVYGWTAKLGLLAIGREALELRAPFVGYRFTDCSGEV